MHFKFVWLVGFRSCLVLFVIISEWSRSFSFWLIWASVHAFYSRNVLQLPTHIQDNRSSSSSIERSQTEFGCTFFPNSNDVIFTSYVLICIEVVRTHAYTNRVHVAKGEGKANTHAHQVDTNCRRCSKDSNAVVSSYSICDKSPSLFCCRRVLSFALSLSNYYCVRFAVVCLLANTCSCARLLVCSFTHSFICSSRFSLSFPTSVTVDNDGGDDVVVVVVAVVGVLSWHLPSHGCYTQYISSGRLLSLSLSCVYYCQNCQSREKKIVFFLLLLISYRYNVLDACVRACVHTYAYVHSINLLLFFIHSCARIDFVICDLHTDDIVCFSANPCEIKSNQQQANRM